MIRNYVHSGYGIPFHGQGWWNFGNDFARNVVFFGFHNSRPSHSDNHKNNFLVLGKRHTSDNNGTFGASGKKFSINFRKAKKTRLFEFIIHGW